MLPPRRRRTGFQRQRRRGGSLFDFKNPRLDVRVFFFRGRRFRRAFFSLLLAAVFLPHSASPALAPLRALLPPRRFREVSPPRQRVTCETSAVVRHGDLGEFLQIAKEAYHSTPEQRERQDADYAAGGMKLMRTKKRSRWSREQQRRAGSHQMWQLISCCGRWDPSFFENHAATSAGVSQPGGVTKKEKQKTIEAVLIRHFTGSIGDLIRDFIDEG